MFLSGPKITYLQGFTTWLSNTHHLLFLKVGLINASVMYLIRVCIDGSGSDGYVHLWLHVHIQVTLGNFQKMHSFVSWKSISLQCPTGLLSRIMISSVLTSIRLVKIGFFDTLDIFRCKIIDFEAYGVLHLWVRVW